MKKIFKNTLKITIGIAVSGFLVFLTLKGADLKLVGGIISRSSLSLVVFGSIIHIASYILIGSRMKVMLGQGMSVFRLTVTVMTGYLFNVLLFRMGDVLKCYLVKDKYDISHAAAVLVIEKSLDTLIVLFCAVFPLFFFDSVPDNIKHVLIVPAVLFFCLMLLLIAAIIYRPLEKWITMFIEKIPFIKKLAPYLCRFMDKLREIGKMPVRFFVVVLISLFLWFVYLLFFFFTIRGVGIHLSLWQTMFVLGITTIGMNVPTTVGFIGTFHYSFFISATLLGTGKELALAGGIVLHLAKIMGHILMGTIGLIIQPLPEMKGIKDVFKQRKECGE